MFVSFVTEQFPPNTVGGLGVHCYYLTRSLAKLGDKVEVLTPGEESGMEGFVEVKRLRQFDANYMDFLLAEELQRWGDPSIMTRYLQFNILASALAEGDVVHCHDWLSVLAGALAKNRGKKFVLTMHSTEEGRTGGRGSDVVRKLEHMGGRLADKVITVSDFMKAELVKMKFPEEKIEVVPNGIDMEKFSPRKVERKKLGLPGEPLVLFIGRLDWVKGIDKLILAMSKINHDARLVVLGVGGWEGHLKSLAAEAGVTDRVVFKNEFVSEEERLDLLAAADICCFPSRYEPFGIVALEGMAMGKPVVVGDVGGMKDVVGEAGLKVDPESATDIAKKLDMLLEDEALREELSMKGRKRAGLFDWDEIAKKTKAVYGGAL